MPTTLKDSIFEGAYDQLKYLNMSPEEQFHYFRVHKKALYTELDRIDEFERGKEEGVAEGEKKGLAKGKKAGLAEGEKKGLAKGKKAGETAAFLETAQKMKADYLPVETIAHYTGLSIDEINRL